MTTDGRLARGARTRTAILDAAVALATEAGLDGLSLGQLAETLGVSKSGLFAHWRSKEELQLATIERAREQWSEQVIAPALRVPRGIRRLWALHEARLDFYAAAVLPGGCFFGNAEFEYNARSGPVRDRLAEALTEWIAFVERLGAEAIAAGELEPDVDVRQLAYEFEAFGLNAALRSRLLAPESAYVFARRAVLDRLRALCTDPTLLPEDSR
ncbi:transcriptional regulator, TetR family [Micromonospora pattaloongensis]|uniref:Transcriptional regulator, TetR family n=1 Tax=Micromonospora pattaloongensis TaxID=405436 RepID=A0A1H3HH99_9ACTN|nr:TetR/AcrR family transcriptional regulator [Micromonospora pattaloongensis]SDY14164.1 transcriptional regulator, TetR family [Micromonospora pattaloongensis]